MASNSSAHRPDAADYSRGVKYLVDTAPEMKTLPPEYVLPLPASPLSVASASIPVVDVSGLDGTPDERLSTVQALSSACAEWGFFRITDHGIKMSLMEEMMKEVEGFFNLSWEEKMKYESKDVMDEVRYGTSLNTPAKHALHWRDYLRHFGFPFHHTFHLWPPLPPHYRDVAKEYLEEVWKLSLRLAGAISEGLGLESDYVQEAFGDGCQILACNYYPPCPEPNKTLGLAAHSDHGGLVFLTQNDVDGLQVKHDDAWVAVHHVPGTFVVNVGDSLEILSNGRYKSVEHRAVVNDQRTRISVAASYGPQLTVTLQPASPLVKDKPMYRPIVYKDYQRLQQSCTTRGKNSLQSITTQSPLPLFKKF